MIIHDKTQPHKEQKDSRDANDPVVLSPWQHCHQRHGRGSANARTRPGWPALTAPQSPALWIVQGRFLGWLWYWSTTQARRQRAGTQQSKAEVRTVEKELSMDGSGKLAGETQD